MLPWQPSYLCCVDALNGKAETKETFVRKLSNKTLEGAPAVSSELVLFPQGRVAPQAFRRTDGRDLGSIKKSGGGSIVVVSLDSRIMHGPGTDSRKGGISQTNPKTLEMVASYGRGNALIVSDRISYMLTDDELIASNLATRKVIFKKSCSFPFGLIGVGSTLFAGGDQQVAAFDTKNGEKLWERPVNGRAYGLAFSNGQLFVSTDRGAIHAFRIAATPSKDNSSQVPEGDSVGEEKLSTLPVAKFSHPNLLGRWVFDQSTTDGKSIRNLGKGNACVAENKPRYERSGKRQAISLDGARQSLLVASSHRQAKIPSKAMTVEAWARVDVGQKWGGIVGALQDNGDFERGWVLGFQDQKFSFALAGTEKNGKLTYLTAPTEFVRQTWNHVAATYDGSTMSLFVNGEKVSTSKDQAGDINYPPQAFYTIGAYRDRDEFYRMKGAIHEVRVYDSVLSPSDLKAHYNAKAQDFAGPKATHEVLVGPWLKFTRPGQAVVRWRTQQPSPSTVILKKSNSSDEQRLGDGKRRVKHEVHLRDLDRNELYLYSVVAERDGKLLSSREFECDTFFDYSTIDFSKTELFDDFETDRNAQVRQRRAIANAAEILKRAKCDRGICLVVGVNDGRLAWELLKQSNMRIVCIDNNRANAMQLRERLHKKKIAGGRFSVCHVTDFNKIPFVGHFANLIASERPAMKAQFLEWSTVARLLRPDGGVFVAGSVKSDDSPAEVTEPLDTFNRPLVRVNQDNLTSRLSDDEHGRWLVVTKQAFKGAGHWTHLYGNADNSGFGGEELGDARTKDDLTVQWVGRPGPRYQSDRSGRKPSPLAVNGRLLLQGLDRIIALDSYNGTVLWALEIPGFQRFNVPRDCGNWCADDDFIFAAVRDRVWKIDAATGSVIAHLQMPETKIAGPGQKDWGFVAREGDILLGSTLPQHTSWTDFWGKKGWYDQRSGPESFKICSDNLFARNANDGALLWQRTKGVVVNSTVTIDNGVMYFVESRNQKVLDSKSRRVGMPELWKDQYLVAIDVNTGSTRWETPIDTKDGTVAFYMAHGKDRLVIVSSTDTHYFVYGFSDVDGKQLWDQSFQWIEGKGDHGKAMSRPAIVGDNVFVRPKVLSLTDGKLKSVTMPGGGCGTYACTTNSLFFRAGEVTMWDATNGSSSKFTRLRPDCWVSTIPAGGMLLSPEGGGGCSCGSWMETSIGFMPKKFRPASK
jgi:outer membrane protein assembly factor BamB